MIEELGTRFFSNGVMTEPLLTAQSTITFEVVVSKERNKMIGNGSTPIPSF